MNGFMLLQVSESVLAKSAEMAEKDPQSLVDSINDEKRIKVLSIVHGILEIFLNTMIGNYDLGRTLIDG